MRDEEDDINYEPEWGVTIGPMMKGAVIDGDVLGWTIDEAGEPHHDDVDPDGRRYLQLTHFFIKKDDHIDIAGHISQPLEFASDILNFFSSYSNDTEAHVDIGWFDAEFSFRGTVGQLKTFFKLHAPPDPNDYDDSVSDVEFEADYKAWTKKTKEKKTAREILGRGGREDNWQHEDADTSRSFSVYNPKRKKVRKKSR